MNISSDIKKFRKVNVIFVYVAFFVGYVAALSPPSSFPPLQIPFYYAREIVCKDNHPDLLTFGAAVADPLVDAHVCSIHPYHDEQIA